MPSGINPEENKQRAQYLNMRGAQIADSGLEHKPAPEPRGSRRQLVGTIVGIAAVVVVAVLLKAFGVL